MELESHERQIVRWVVKEKEKKVFSCFPGGAWYNTRMNKKVRPSKIVESKELLDRLTHITNIGQFDTLTEAHEAFKKFIKIRKKG